MSSTKRKQNKPQKIFNSKSNKNLSSETTTTNSKIDDKIEETNKPQLNQQEEPIWRVINNDLSTNTMKETQRDEDHE